MISSPHSNSTPQIKPALRVSNNRFPRKHWLLGEVTIQLRDGDHLHKVHEIIGNRQLKQFLEYLYIIYQKNLKPATRHEIKKALDLSGTRSIELMIKKLNSLLDDYDTRGIKIVGKKKVKEGKRDIIYIYLQTIPVFVFKGNLAFLMNTSRTFDTTPTQGKRRGK